MIRSRLKRSVKKLLGREGDAPPSVQRAVVPNQAPKTNGTSHTNGVAKAAPKAETAPAEATAEPAKVVAPKVAAKAPAPAKTNGVAAKKTTQANTKEPAADPIEAAPEPAPKKKKSSFASLAAMAASGDLGVARHADQAGTDLEAYRERMRANGREVELAGVGLNVAEDGAKFVGPVDNESSRAAADGQVLSIDQHECISCGTCVEQTEDVFFLGEDDKSGEEVKAEVLKQEGAMDLIQDAIDACPVTCIHWVEPDELDEHHSAGGFQPRT